MGIPGYGTHFGGMVISWLIIIALFAVLIYFVARQSRSSGTAPNRSNKDAGNKSNDG